MDEYTRIAELLESGKITAEEAQRLIEALEEEARPPPLPPEKRKEGEVC
ncbi:SHOCT-like domain-containing protein, partial [Oceanithermus sp.]